MNIRNDLSSGMKLPEVLAPAGSMEAVRAAVQNGADAVYMGFGSFNARRNAKNFTQEEMAEAISYCRTRSVKTNITVNTLISDKELPALMKDIEFLVQSGADALIVQDLGVSQLIRRHAPGIDLHASTQMTVHSLDGALFAKKMGFSRVVLSRELSFEQIKYITENAGIETEVFVHGALCMCYSGQCYLSAVIGQRSGNRGLCAQPCRLPYSYDGKKQGYSLSLKDLSLASYLNALAEAGVSSLKIEGRMKRPEYVAIVSKIYASVLKERREPTVEELQTLQSVFSRDGFTQGYYLSKKGPEMFGTKTEIPLEQVKDLYNEAARTFEAGREMPRTPVSFSFSAKDGAPVSLSASVPFQKTLSGDGTISTELQIEPAEKARNRELTAFDVEKALSKTGGTIFYADKIDVDLDKGLMLPASSLNYLRRSALDALTQQINRRPEAAFLAYKPEKKTANPSKNFEGYTVQVRSLEQFTESMLRNKPKTLYAPAEVFLSDCKRTEQIIKSGIETCVVLPHILFDTEIPKLKALLEECFKIGVKAALVSNVGQIDFAISLGFKAYGDYGLNIFNSESMLAFAKQNVSRLTASFELKMPQIRDLVKPVDTEMIVYGRLPLMIFENCAIKRKSGACSCKSGITTLTDRMGMQFPLMPENGCRNTLYNSQPLYFGEKAGDYQTVGVTFGRLLFTTESPDECDKIYEAHLSGKLLTFKEGSTRGLYYRGVE